jgi:hypothetical protein
LTEVKKIIPFFFDRLHYGDYINLFLTLTAPWFINSTLSQHDACLEHIWLLALQTQSSEGSHKDLTDFSKARQKRALFF